MTRPDLNALEAKALAAMETRRQELNVKGSAVVAITPPDQPESFVMQARIMGRYERPPDPSRGEGDKGTNFFSIAFSKLTEMVATQRDSGESPDRVLKKGEFGYKGGLVRHKDGYTLYAAFSGGSEAQDLEISEQGMQELLKL